MRRFLGSTPEATAGSDIGQRYRVVKELGRGGMGAVYRAYDRELERDVALKLIRSDLAESPTALERFKREIQISSKVTHKNVLRVYDLGEADGLRFLTMQFVEGEDLATRMKREGQLPLQAMLSIFRQTSNGLAAAHELGVLHRDLKPQNIMIDRAGVVYITDFGLAKSMGTSGMTQTGAVLGTPYYMSPEQVKGEPLDERSDIYSLGVILYELATGTVPFTGSSAFEVMIQRVQRPPRPAGEINPELPTYVRKILDRCLAIDKRLRYASVNEILADLDAANVRTSLYYEIRRRRWLRPALVWVLIGALAVGAQQLHERKRTQRAGKDSGASALEAVPVVGVIPFENRTGEKALDWYGEGMARLVADSLAQSRHVRVLSADRVQAILKGAGDSGSLASAAAAAGVDYLLTGEILLGPSGQTMSARLTETREGRELAGKRIDGLTPATLISSSDQIAVAAKKGLGIPPTESVDVYAADFASKNSEAYESYVTGLRALMKFRYPEAERGFATALAKAPDYTMARYRLAYVHAITGRTEKALAEIRQAAAEASRLSDREARYIRAAENYYARQYDEAIKAYQELISRYPYEMEAREHLAEVFFETRQYTKAVEEARIMSQLEPDSHAPWSVLGEAHLALRDFNQAVLALKRYVELEPEHPNGHHLLGDSYRCQGEFDLAAEEYGKALAGDPNFHFSTTALAVLDVLRGRREDAEGRLRALAADTRAIPRHRIDAAFDLASLLRASGRFREAARVLETLEKPLAEEKEREAMALAVRGNSLMEAGDLPGARRLIEKGIERSPGGPPTRYLFARGLLELRLKKYDDVRRTTTKILENALPASDSDRTEDKAAAYLTGMAFLGEGKAARAVEDLSRSVTLSGYEYGIYRRGLARAYLAAGNLTGALAAARQAAAPLDPVEPRLDLELDRTRAQLVLAQVHAAMGRPSEAGADAHKFLDVWKHADPGGPDLAQARKLARVK